MIDREKRIKKLEQKAWKCMTGEDIKRSLSDLEADEYEELVYGDLK